MSQGSDLPPGSWSGLLVGHQWPHSSALAVLRAASAQRHNGEQLLSSYADVLRSIRLDALTIQEGHTAESSRALFTRGERHSHDIATKLRAKRQSYDDASRSVESLRDALTGIAAEGNAAIEAVLQSQSPTEVKVSEIVGIVTQANADADMQTALCAGNVYAAVQSVLNSTGDGNSARTFAAAQGVPASGFGRSQTDALTQADALTQRVAAQLATAPTTDSQPAVPPTGATSLHSAGTASATPTSTSHPLSAGDRPGATLALGTGQWNEAAASAITEVMATAAANPVRTVAPAEFTEPSTGAPTPVSEPLTAWQPHTSPPALPGPGMQAAPISAIATPVTRGDTRSSALPAAGPLAPYGTDPKSSATSPPVTPTAPTSAPVSSSAAIQSAVSRQQTAPVTAIAGTRAAAVPERAVPADATYPRLRRLLEAVARQEPQLRWAVADFRDGRTLVVTDLAGGWIPPRIDIPAGLQLAQPTGHHRDLAALLQGATRSAVYEPGQPLAGERADTTMRMSTQARDTRAVDDLGWELARATKWRDGLPRLAHTLATAAVSKTGYLDLEVELLGHHLATVRDRVLERYPADVHHTQLGNWQLLATIDALLRTETTCANYHFAWFTAASITRDHC